MASSELKVESTDLKTAFLQRKETERVVCVRPLKEANKINVWKLQKMCPWTCRHQ